MFNKKIVLLIFAAFLLNSCADTWDSVKRGLTGQKAKSTDEFLVEKKDPLVLPPDFEQLPTPGERDVAKTESFSLEETLGNATTTTGSSSTSSTEQSILEQIRKK